MAEDVGETDLVLSLIVPLRSFQWGMDLQWPDLIPQIRHVSLVAMNSVPQLNLAGGLCLECYIMLPIQPSGPEFLWSGTPVGNGLSTDSRHGAPQLSASHWAPLGSDQLTVG